MMDGLLQPANAWRALIIRLLLTESFGAGQSHTAQRFNLTSFLNLSSKHGDYMILYRPNCECHTHVTSHH
jgi:hypothetical protein